MTQAMRAPREITPLRSILLAVILLNLGLIVTNVLLYTPLLQQVGGAVYVAEPLVLLVIYALIVLVVTAGHGPNGQARRATLALATTFGVVTGALWVVNLTLETFGSFSGPMSILATAPFLLGGFVLWGVAGLLRAQQTGSLRSGLLAAIWSAMLCVLITIAYGFALLFVALPRLSANLTNDPDFVRSHWSDLHAFTLANTFDAAFSHLLGALLVSLVFGTIGALLGVTIRRVGRRARQSQS